VLDVCSRDGVLDERIGCPFNEKESVQGGQIVSVSVDWLFVRLHARVQMTFFLFFPDFIGGLYSSSTTSVQD
jgi:hypothetical protein